MPDAKPLPAECRTANAGRRCGAASTRPRKGRGPRLWRTPPNARMSSLAFPRGNRRSLLESGTGFGRQNQRGGKEGSRPNGYFASSCLRCVALALLLFAGGAGRAVRFSTAEKSRFRKKSPTTPVRTNLGKRDCPFWPPSMLRPGKVAPPDKFFFSVPIRTPLCPPPALKGAQRTIAFSKVSSDWTWGSCGPRLLCPGSISLPSSLLLS